MGIKILFLAIDLIKLNSPLNKSADLEIYKSEPPLSEDYKIGNKAD
jgi:hypothetical protein